jgi:SAM-dependent methyltransferase
MVKKLLKLDLGAGENVKEGFLGVDFYANHGCRKVNLLKFPWPWKANSVEEVFCSHFFEHVPNRLRIQFMDEVWRILIPEGKATFVTPYWSSPRAIQDPTHEWPPIAEQSYLYFNKKWREDNQLTHYLGKCDFDFTYGYNVDQETAAKNMETQAFHVKHYLNAVSDLQVIMTKRPNVHDKH